MCHYFFIFFLHVVSQAAKLDGSDEFEELQEAREAELQSFNPASRETEADRTGDMKSLQRKLDRVLYLLVKKPRKEHAWQMPQGGLEQQESLIEVHVPAAVQISINLTVIPMVLLSIPSIILRVNDLKWSW